MTRPENKCESRPVIVPECFLGEECYEDLRAYQRLTRIHINEFLFVEHHLVSTPGIT